MTTDDVSIDDPDLVKDGDRVLIYLDPRRTWLVQASKDAVQFHTHAGIVDLSKVVGLRFGDMITTTLGERMTILRPVTLDYIMKSERRTQIVYPKDFSYIAARSGIRSGSRVLECGTGSGALTSFFASLVATQGYVHTFEAREDFFSIAKKNVSKAGLSQFVKFENSNLQDSSNVLRSTCYDLAILDTGDPWHLLKIAHKALRGSGFVFCICPTTNQLETVVETMKDGLFCDVESVEIMLRQIEARAGKTRPSMRMVGHTCYIASGRKIQLDTQDIENVKSA
jgi:tRNA (adenine57-N1/adenine58-N1)-methyltransferase